MSTTSTQKYDAVVIGAGFSGLYMLHKLRQLGLSATVIEAGDDVGGTWYWNRYPGCRCDVESMHYSYSFDEELEQEWEWSEKYPAQPEIHAYLRHVADRHDLRKDITFGTRVTAAHFDESAGRWTVTTDKGEEYDAQYVVSAVGCLSTPKPPEVLGLERFSGEWYHTAMWPDEKIDFTGKRVGIIGTGSSGIQVIPEVAREAAELLVFQRTPNYTVPTYNGPIDPDLVAEIKSNYRSIREMAKTSGFGVPMPPPEKSALEVEPEERYANYEKLWARGSVTAVLTAYTDLLVDQDANDTAADFVRDRIREAVKDPATAEALCPTDYPFGTKRPTMGTNYYETFNSDHVTLVNLREAPLVSITEKGLRTEDREYEFDVLILATGFDAMTGPLMSIDIRGREGQELKEKWADGPHSYLGLSVAGFPNLFTITGPGSPSVLTNMPVAIEQHVDWIGDLLAHMKDSGISVVEADEVKEKEWGDVVRDYANATLHMKANSWYLGANVPGKPRVFMVYTGGLGLYRETCDRIAEAGYDGFELTV